MSLHASADIHALEQAAEGYLSPKLQAHARDRGWRGLRLAYQHQLLGSDRPKPCDQALQVSGAEGDLLGRQRLLIHCRAGEGWSRTLLSQPRLFVQAVYAKGTIERGTDLATAPLQLRELELDKAQRDFYGQLQQLKGLEARRRIRTNQLLSPSLVKSARLITRGEQIKITANHQGISASTAGQALQDGEHGEMIRVRNISSDKTIDARVIEAGVVSSTN